MKYLILIIILITQPSFAAKKDINIIYNELKEFHEGLLRSNYQETILTVWVKITDALIHEEMFPIYTKYKFKCNVIEIFKGKEEKEIEYIRFMETLSSSKKLKEHIGKTGIISVFFDKEKSQYYIGDNGYNLPDTPYLLEIARKLKTQNKGMQ